MPTVIPAKTTFTRDLFKAAKAAKPEITDGSAALITAHGAYESNWGSCIAAREGFNYWNLTAGAAWLGPITMGGDLEFTAGSSAGKAITQKFRKYGAAVSAVQNYLGFLSMPRYTAGLNKLLDSDSSFVIDLGVNTYGPDGKSIVNAWSPGLVKGGFYTLPIPKYSAEFKAVLLDVQAVLTADGVKSACI